MKSDGAINHDALLHHEVYHLRHEKEKEIERKRVFKLSSEREVGNKSHYECGESSTAQQRWVPQLTPLGESGVYMNFPDFHAPSECRTEALNITRSWSADLEKIRSQLAKNVVSE